MARPPSSAMMGMERPKTSSARLAIGGSRMQVGGQSHVPPQLRHEERQITQMKEDIRQIQLRIDQVHAKKGRVAVPPSTAPAGLFRSQSERQGGGFDIGARRPGIGSRGPTISDAMQPQCPASENIEATLGRYCFSSDPMQVVVAKSGLTQLLADKVADLTSAMLDQTDKLRSREKDAALEQRSLTKTASAFGFLPPAGAAPLSAQPTVSVAPFLFAALDRIEDLGEQLTSKTENSLELERRVSLSRMDTTRLEGEQAPLRTRLAVAENENKSLKEKLGKANARLQIFEGGKKDRPSTPAAVTDSQLKKQVEDMHMKLSNTQKSNLDLLAKNEQLRKQLEALQRQVGQNTTKKDDGSAAAKVKLLAKEEECKQLSLNMAEYAKQVKKLEEEVKKLVAESASKSNADKDVKALEDKVRTLEGKMAAERDGFGQARTQLEKKAATAAANYEVLKNKSKKSAEDLAVAEKQCKSLRVTVTTKESEIEKLNSQVMKWKAAAEVTPPKPPATTTTESQTIETKNNDGSIDKLKEQLAKAKEAHAADKKAWSTQKTKLDETLNSLTANNAELEVEAIENRKKIDALEASIAKTAESESSRSTDSEELVKLSSQLRAVTDRNAILQKENEEKQQAMEKMTERVTGLQNQVEALTKENDELKQLLEKLRTNQQQNLSSTAESLLARERELEADMRQLLQLKEEAEKLQQDLGVESKQVAAMRAETKEIDDQLTKKQMEYEKALEDLQEKQSKLNRDKMQLAQDQTSLKQSQLDAKQAQLEAKKQKEENAAEKRRLAQLRNELEAEKAFLEREKQELALARETLAAEKDLIKSLGMANQTAPNNNDDLELPPEQSSLSLTYNSLNLGNRKLREDLESLMTDIRSKNDQIADIHRDFLEVQQQHRDRLDATRPSTVSGATRRPPRGSSHSSVQGGNLRRGQSVWKRDPSVTGEVDSAFESQLQEDMRSMKDSFTNKLSKAKAEADKFNGHHSMMEKDKSKMEKRINSLLDKCSALEGSQRDRTARQSLDSDRSSDFRVGRYARK